MKYADDTSLIVLSIRSLFATMLDSLTAWATVNQVKLNGTKWRVMVFTRRSRAACLSLSLPGIESVVSMVVLGITTSRDLRASRYIDRVFGCGPSSLYALDLPRGHVLPTAVLEVRPRGDFSTQPMSDGTYQRLTIVWARALPFQDVLNDLSVA